MKYRIIKTDYPSGDSEYTIEKRVCFIWTPASIYCFDSIAGAEDWIRVITERDKNMKSAKSQVVKEVA